jgi:hypothetical protein
MSRVAVEGPLCELDLRKPLAGLSAKAKGRQSEENCPQVKRHQMSSRIIFQAPAAKKTSDRKRTMFRLQFLFVY